MIRPWEIVDDYEDGIDYIVCNKIEVQSNQLIAYTGDDNHLHLGIVVNEGLKTCILKIEINKRFTGAIIKMRMGWSTV